MKDYEFFINKWLNVYVHGESTLDWNEKRGQYYLCQKNLEIS